MQIIVKCHSTKIRAPSAPSTWRLGYRASSPQSFLHCNHLNLWQTVTPSFSSDKLGFTYCSKVWAKHFLHFNYVSLKAIMWLPHTFMLPLSVGQNVGTPEIHSYCVPTWLDLNPQKLPFHISCRHFGLVLPRPYCWMDRHSSAELLYLLLPTQLTSASCQFECGCNDLMQPTHWTAHFKPLVLGKMCYRACEHHMMWWFQTCTQCTHFYSQITSLCYS